MYVKMKFQMMIDIKIIFNIIYFLESIFWENETE